jgi:hypothetical protein
VAITASPGRPEIAEALTVVIPVWDERYMGPLLDQAIDSLLAEEPDLRTPSASTVVRCSFAIVRERSIASIANRHSPRRLSAKPRRYHDQARENELPVRSAISSVCWRVRPPPPVSAVVGERSLELRRCEFDNAFQDRRGNSLPITAAA